MGVPPELYFWKLLPVTEQKLLCHGPKPSLTLLMVLAPDIVLGREGLFPVGLREPRAGRGPPTPPGCLAILHHTVTCARNPKGVAMCPRVCVFRGR